MLTVISTYFELSLLRILLFPSGQTLCLLQRSNFLPKLSFLNLASFHGRVWDHQGGYVMQMVNGSRIDDHNHSFSSTPYLSSMLLFLDKTYLYIGKIQQFKKTSQSPKSSSFNVLNWSETFRSPSISGDIATTPTIEWRNISNLFQERIIISTIHWINIFRK